MSDDIVQPASPEIVSGMISAGAAIDREERARESARKKVSAPKRKLDPGESRFVTDRGSRHTIKIVPLGDSEEDRALAEKAIAANLGNKLLEFFDSVFMTGDPSISLWMRTGIVRGKLNGITDDATLVDVRCSMCDFSVKNTEDGKRALAMHMLAEHGGVSEAA